VPVINVPQAQLTIIVSPACIGFQILRTTEDRVIIATSHSGDILPGQNINQPWNIEGLCVSMSQLTFHVKPESVHFPVIYQSDLIMLVSLLVSAMTCSQPLEANIFTTFFPLSFSINLSCPVL
jgi:hypothetical protein